MVAHFKNAECLYNQLATLVTSRSSSWPYELAHKSWQPVFPQAGVTGWGTDCLSTDSLTPWGKDLFALFFLDVELFCADFSRLSKKKMFREKMFSKKCLENHILWRVKARELSRFVPGYAGGSQPGCSGAHTHRDKLLAVSGGAVSWWTGLLVTSWAVARGTGCFESLLKPRLRAVRTGLHCVCHLLVLLCFV